MLQSALRSIMVGVGRGFGWVHRWIANPRVRVRFPPLPPDAPDNVAWQIFGDDLGASVREELKRSAHNARYSPPSRADRLARDYIRHLRLELEASRVREIEARKALSQLKRGVKAV